jgi:hypothetical protein
VTEADLLGGRGEMAEQHFGRPGVREPREEVVLDSPHVREPDALGELNLLDRLAVDLLLSRAPAVQRHLNLVQHPESHGGLLLCRCGAQDLVLGA